ncbi:serine--tRNA ligase [Gammaproteobacteria bacterium]|nr:serine--tRNA ligase [Gammaproteobacteria bacterium]MDC3323369.1 serine--tRNA ligase [Gammaproteobacteria bacterium]|tara:strand:+ start:6039 stop:7310 length:1272 start_codon:yes stop_codon:yes gene_type:complete
MLDPKKLRKETSEVALNLSRRGFNFDQNTWNDLESERKKLQGSNEEQQSKLNDISKEIGLAVKEGKDSTQLKEQASELTALIKTQSKTLDDLLEDINQFVLSLPNLIDEDVPDGKNEDENLEIISVGSPRQFNFSPKDHLEIGDNRGIDMEAGVKITGSRFKVLKNEIAHLQRALLNFMLDTHVKDHGYEEVYVPYIVNKESLIGTGQLPKFEEDLFKIDGENNFYLTSTAEVPVTNLLRDEILESETLPLKYVCHTPCFRSEAGSYGKDTRGIMRLHQFEKVELVQAVESSDSEEALEELTGHAEAILQKLELPYRKVSLCSGDIGFSAAKTYDLEVWVPSQEAYREISSCSNFRDFQARRMKARWKNPSNNKIELLNTINGSGLALSRTVLAILENYQESDGSVAIPDVLRSYMGKDRILS